MLAAVITHGWREPTPFAWAAKTPIRDQAGVADALDLPWAALFVLWLQGHPVPRDPFTQAFLTAKSIRVTSSGSNSMPADVQDGIMEASEINASPEARQSAIRAYYAMAELRKAGVRVPLVVARISWSEWQAAGGSSALSGTA